MKKNLTPIMLHLISDQVCVCSTAVPIVPHWPHCSAYNRAIVSAINQDEWLTEVR